MIALDIDAAGTLALAVTEVRHRPIVVQLPAVFVLLAAPTLAGAAQLDAAKSRLPGKNYGTAIGSLSHFLAQAVAEEMPAEFSRAEHFECMTGAFIRLRFRDPAFESSAVRAGTHQGVLLDGVHRTLFREIEASFLRLPPDPLWAGRNYCAPLCTSANESGHADGSIVELDKALAFAKDNGIGLVVTCRASAAERGSYPILGFTRDRVSVHRDGPGLERFKERVPARLRAWADRDVAVARPGAVAA